LDDASGETGLKEKKRMPTINPESRPVQAILKKPYALYRRYIGSHKT
jgi:hypothetical protein